MAPSRGALLRSTVRRSLGANPTGSPRRQRRARRRRGARAAFFRPALALTSPRGGGLTAVGLGDALLACFARRIKRAPRVAGGSSPGLPRRRPARCDYCAEPLRWHGGALGPALGAIGHRARASPPRGPVHRGALCPRARRPCVGQRRRGSVIADAGGRVRLSVPDDGRGCATPTGGCGLTGLRERLALRGGPVQAADRAEGGWALRVEISG